MQDMLKRVNLDESYRRGGGIALIQYRANCQMVTCPLHLSRPVLLLSLLSA